MPVTRVARSADAIVNRCPAGRTDETSTDSEDRVIGYRWTVRTTRNTTRHDGSSIDEVQIRAQTDSWSRIARGDEVCDRLRNPGINRKICWREQKFLSRDDWTPRTLCMTFDVIC